jgi:hypothetical protein
MHCVHSALQVSSSPDELHQCLHLCNSWYRASNLHILWVLLKPWLHQKYIHVTLRALFANGVARNSSQTLFVLCISPLPICMPHCAIRLCSQKKKKQRSKIKIVKNLKTATVLNITLSAGPFWSAGPRKPYQSYTQEVGSGCHHQALDRRLPLRLHLLIFIFLLTTFQTFWPFLSLKSFKWARYSRSWL